MKWITVTVWLSTRSNKSF